MKTRIVKKPDVRRDEILNSFQRLIYTKGYEQMTIQDILDDLQIAKGTIYHYFNSKHALLEALVDRMAAEQVAPIISSIVEDPHLTALEKLGRYFDTSTRWKSVNKALLVELVKVGYSDENALFRQKAFARMVQHLGPVFTEVIEQGVREGVFATPYPEVAGLVIINLIQSLADIVAKMLISEEAKQSDTFQRAETLFVGYSDALERVLGAPKGSTLPMATEALKAWFSPTDTTP